MKSGTIQLHKIEALMTAKVDKIFSGRQLCQVVKDEF
jgi:hypothetical protein